MFLSSHVKVGKLHLIILNLNYRQGLGVEVHCSDVGLEDPSVTAKHHVRNEKNMSENEKKVEKYIVKEQPLSYQAWIQQAQVTRNADWTFNVALHESKDTSKPPHYDKV